MSKSNVYDFFSKRRVDVNPQPGELEDTPILPEKLEKHLDIEVLANMLNTLTLFRQAGSLRQGNIDKRRELIKDTQAEVLFTWVNTSTQRDWQARPAFYAAVYEELSARGLARRG